MRLSTLLRVAEDSAVAGYNKAKPVALSATCHSASWISRKFAAVAAATEQRPVRKAKRA